MCCLSKAFECFVVGNDRIAFAARICEAGRKKTSISKIKTLLVPKFIPNFLLTTKRLVILNGKIAIAFARCLASANV